MNIETIRRAAALGLASAVVTVGGLTASAPANASTATPAAQAMVAVATPALQLERSSDWRYSGHRYHHRSDCRREGRKHVRNGDWDEYECRYYRRHNDHDYYYYLWYRDSDNNHH